MRAVQVATLATLVGLTCVSLARADEDVDRAFAAARVNAIAGDVVAQFSLGAMLYYGGNDTA